MFTDTHCHIHSNQFGLDARIELESAKRAGVAKLILVGEDAADSELAVAMAQTDRSLFAIVGLHPHEAHTVASRAGDVAPSVPDGVNHDRLRGDNDGDVARAADLCTRAGRI